VETLLLFVPTLITDYAYYLNKKVHPWRVNKVTKVISCDGPDYAGKSELVKRIAEVLRAAGYTVATFNHPGSESPNGQRARNLVLQNASRTLISEAMVEDFFDTMHGLTGNSLDFLLLDRFAASTIVYQGDEGKASVFQSGVARTEVSPTVYIALDVDYNTAIERAKKRIAEKGASWDDEVLTSQYLQSATAWDDLRERYRFAHHILTEGGSYAQLIRYDTVTAGKDELMKLVADICQAQ
jgi:thymidylate kinase